MSGSKYNLKENQQENYTSDVNGTPQNKNPSMFIHSVTQSIYNLSNHKSLYSQSPNLSCLKQCQKQCLKQCLKYPNRSTHRFLISKNLTQFYTPQFQLNQFNQLKSQSLSTSTSLSLYQSQFLNQILKIMRSLEMTSHHLIRPHPLMKLMRIIKVNKNLIRQLNFLLYTLNGHCFTTMTYLIK